MKKIIGICVLSFLQFQHLAAYTQLELDGANTLASQGVISSQENPADYRLKDNITRKEFMKVVANITQDTIEDTCKNSFSDVENDWGCKYIEWALEKGFIASNQTFRPNDNITRAESMKLILKAREIERVADTGDWRMDDMSTAYKVGIIPEIYGNFDIQATRGWIFEVSATDIGAYGSGNRVINPMNLVP